jgi:hypothetical protein
MHVKLGQCLRRWKWPLEVFERKILRSTKGLIQGTAEWKIRCSKGIYGLCKDLDVVTYTELRIQHTLGVSAAWMDEHHGKSKEVKQW